MSLQAQKTLLADVRALSKDALELYNSGVKIPGVVQKLRAAGDELEQRVRFIEKQEAAPKSKKKSAEKKSSGDSKPPEPTPAES